MQGNMQTNSQLQAALEYSCFDGIGGLNAGQGLGVKSLPRRILMASE